MTGRALRAAVVGAGPAALYVVEQLLEQDDIDVEIDVFERLPTPWGLVRNGVAPDHPEKKLVIDRLFSFLLADKRVRFIGNMEVGRDLGHDELAQWYSAVIYAIGATGDLRLNIPGEDLEGSVAARDFIAWAAGHPDHIDCSFDLTGERAVIFGNGNVALDVARLLTLPIGQFERTEIADHALEALRASQLREVVILGRRDRSSSAFNNPELEELEHLEHVHVTVEGDEGQACPAVPSRVLRRKLATFDRLASRACPPGARRIVLRFLSSPVALEGDGRVENVLIVSNRLEFDQHGVANAKATGDVSRLPCALAIRAVGYRGTPQPGLPFDDARGVIANIGGRILDKDTILPGRYVVGWAKRGCRGIIGSNKKCARETVAALLADLKSGRISPASADRQTIIQLVAQKNPHAVSHTGWSAINRAELNAGRKSQRPRVKIIGRERLLQLAATCAGSDGL